MVEVLLETSIGQLSNDLYSSINWSKVGLKTFKEFKNSIFKEFEERELRFNVKYEKVTPFANQQIEIKYINEVQFVGEEEEFNLDMFNIFEEDANDSVEDSLSVDNLFIEESLVENLVLKTTKDGFDYYGVELEEEVEDSDDVSDSEDESDEGMEEQEDYFEDSYTEELQEVQISYPEEKPLEEPLEDYSSSVISTGPNSSTITTPVVESEEDIYSSVDELLGSVEEPPIVNVKPPVPKVAPTVEKPRRREISYHEGMSLRQFLRENPRSTMEVAEKYFTRREIMKEIQLGRVIKRGQKLFI